MGLFKKFLKIGSIFLLVTLLLIAIYYIWTNFSNSIPFLNKLGITSKASLKLTEQTNIDQVIEESFPEIFVSSLKYDQTNNSVTQITINKTKGEIPSFLTNKPEDSSEDLIYLVEVTDKNGNLVESGWKVVSKKILPVKDENLIFTVINHYYKDGIVRVYINDKLVWTGKML